MSGLTGAAGGFFKTPMLVCMFGLPINVAFDLDPDAVADGDRGIAWHDLLLLSVFVLAGSQIGPRITLRTRPKVMRRRFAINLFALAGLVLASSCLGPGDRMAPLPTQ